jgi:YD repeat-containing protein
LKGLDFIRRLILPGNESFEWTPNNLGLPTSLKLPDLTTVGFDYNTLGQRTGETLPNGWQDAHTTSDGQFVRQSNFSNPGQNLTIEQQRTYQGYSGKTTGFHSDTLQPGVPMGKFGLDVQYYKNGSIKREIVKVAGQTVYQRLYEWDKNWNFMQVLDELTGWRAVMGLDDSGRLISINTMAGTGPNPFPWPVGLTTVTTDANGAIRALQNGAWRVAMPMRSNAIAVARDGVLIGIGCGQTSRVRAVRYALEQAGENARGAAVASDAFFPFPDSIELAARAGIRAVVAPKGSIRDAEVADRARSLGLTLYFAPRRHFRH